MNVQLPGSLENSVRSLVEGGRFASVDDAMVAAARLLLKEAGPVAEPMTELDLLQHMIAIGLMTQLPDHNADHDDPKDVPIDISGEPLSATIIRERR